MRKTLFIFLSIFLTVITLLTLIIFPKSDKSATNTQVKCLELWHLDMIEGGIGSRISLLKKVANNFSKNSGVLLSVKSQTPESVSENFSKGIYPDLISYSNGLNLPFERVCEIEKGEYAKCWCKGGYLYIARKNQRINGVIISAQEYALTLLAYYIEDIKMPIEIQVDSAKAIYHFYQRKDLALIGTQRDLFRLENKGIEVEVKQIEKFNDLYQYISIIYKDNNYTTAKSFINYLLYYCKQENALKNIGMLPGEGYNQACNSILKVFLKNNTQYTTYPLLTLEGLKNLQNLCKNYQTNAQSIKNALKRLK